MKLAGLAMLLVGALFLLSRVLYVKRMRALTAALPEEARPHFFTEDQASVDAAAAAVGWKPGEEIIKDYPAS